MPRAPWATPAQETFLFTRLEDYKDAQKKGSYLRFWPALYEDWEKEFPTHEEILSGQDLGNITEDETKRLQEAIKERRNQLQTWYRWKCNKRARTAEQTQTTKLEKELFAARKRIPHKSEVYSKLCYDEKIKPVVTARCEEQEVTSSGEKLRVINEVTREMFDKELPEVKEQVDAILSDIQAKRDVDAQSSASRTAEEYLRAILECPALLGRFLSALADKTGWAYTVLMGGPDPNANGDICVASFHVGESVQGHTFGQAHPNFETAYMEPFSEFLRHAFSLDVRQARSLNSIPDTGKGEVGGGDGGGFDVGGSQIPRLITSNVPTVSPPSPVRAPPASHAPLRHPDAPPTVAHSSPLTDAPPTVSQSSPLIDAPPTAAHSSSTDAPPTAAHSSPTEASATHNLASPTAGALPIAGASPHSSGSTLPSDILPPAIFVDPAASPMSTIGDGASGVGAFNFGLFNFDLFDLQPQLDWPTLPGFTGEFNDSFSGHGSLTAELNDWAAPIPNFDPALFLTPPEPTFDLGAFALSPQSSQHQPESAELPLRLDAFPFPAPAPAPAPATVPSIPSMAAPPLATSRYSGRAILPSTRANKMNDIGSTKSTPTIDFSDSNKENHPPGTIQEPPSWLLAAEAYLTDNNFGTEWTECIKAWRAFEAHLGYSNKKPMSHINLRPEEWSNWISKGRNGIRAYDQTPHIASPLEFGIAVMKWWSAMQPSFRKSTNSPMPLPVYDNPEDSNCWDALKRGGPNGMLSVMTLLSWWGQSRKTVSQWEESSETRWVACVVDIRRVLERVISGKKRGSSASAVASKKVKI